MAIRVVRTSSQYAEATFNPVSGNAFTMAVWYRPSSIANGTALGIGDTNSSAYGALGMNGSGSAFIEVRGQNASAGVLTTDVWAHIAGVQTTNMQRVAYLNSVAGVANTNFGEVLGADRTTVGGLVLNGARLSFAGGDVAEAAIWDVALTALEVADLAAGALPSTVRSEALVFYRRLLDDTFVDAPGEVGTPLVPGAGGAAPTSAIHPPVGHTHETMAWQTSYVVCDRATNTLASSYVCRDRITSTWSSSYVTQDRTLALWQSGYGVNEYTLMTWESLWATHNHRSMTWPSMYGVRGRTSSTCGSLWITYERVAAVWQTSYVVMGHSAELWPSRYSVRTTGAAIGHRGTLDALEAWPCGMVVRGIELVGT